jgi:hypothetical protein
MRQILIYSDAPCMSQPEVLIPRAQERFDADGKLVEPTTRDLLIRYGAAFEAFVARHRA